MTHSIPFELTYMDPTPRAGMAIQPDEWPGHGTTLVNPDEFDKSYFGADVLRILTGHTIIPTLPVRVNLTGKTLFRCACCSQYKARVSIEFLNDGEPSQFIGGWIYTDP